MPTTIREACRIALETSDPPRKVSKQLFMIAPKIREIDAVLRADAGAAARVFEVHPELAFWRLNGERALEEPKKVKGTPYGPGLALRRGLLVGAGIPAAVARAPPPRGAAADDLLDALACATIARRLHAGLAQPVPAGIRSATNSGCPWPSGRDRYPHDRKTTSAPPTRASGRMCGARR